MCTNNNKETLDPALKTARDDSHGFTLLEILVALFIFTIVSAILVGVLHSVMNAQDGTEKNAAQFREIETAWLLMSNDLAQTVNRSIKDETGKDEQSFKGTRQKISFTHAGWANPTGSELRSTWQRTEYYLKDHTLIRKSWVALDRTEKTPSLVRPLVGKVADLRFEYLNKSKKFFRQWPQSGDQDEPLPRAVRVTLTFANGNTLSQLYVVPAVSK